MAHLDRTYEQSIRSKLKIGRREEINSAYKWIDVELVEIEENNRGGRGTLAGELS